MYVIRCLLPRTDVDMGRHCFSIDLSPEWRDAVKQSGITQEHIDTLIRHYGRAWLDACGYTDLFDHVRHLYRPEHLRVSWGEWGPEHITVPGNACGLDISDSIGSYFRGGRMLLPHNIDSWSQKQLFLLIFCEITEHVVLRCTAEKPVIVHVKTSDGQPVTREQLEGLEAELGDYEFWHGDKQK